MRINKFTCSQCGEHKEVESDISTGYGVNQQGEKVCYECCAKDDIKTMRERGSIVLYFDGNYVINWPSSLKFKVITVKKGGHNFARVRYDYWFNFEGFVWHGYTLGNFTHIAHCKRTKQPA